MLRGRPIYEQQWGALRCAGNNTEFPKFKGADVKIIVSGSRQYELHSSVLRNASPLMKEKLLRDEYAAKLNSKAVKKGITIKYRLDLVKNPECNENGSEVDHILKAVPLDEEGKASVSNPVALDLENGRAVNPTFFGSHSQVHVTSLRIQS